MSGGEGQPKTIGRRLAIADAYRRGLNTVDIAVEFNISRQRVEQIARLEGVAHRHPQKRPKAAGYAPTPSQSTNAEGV